LAQKKFGASKRAVIGALLGAIVGVFLGLPGVIFGPFIGAVIGELSARRNLHQAARSGIGATIGLVLGAALKIALALTMLASLLSCDFFEPSREPSGGSSSTDESPCRHPGGFFGNLRPVPGWGIGQQKSCKDHPQLSGPCFKLRGRLSIHNGTPSLRIWP
jgi:hypothetical protein